MKTINGVQVYEPGEIMLLPSDAPPIPTGDHNALFGYKLVDNEGKKMWTYGMEQDYRAVMKLLDFSEPAIDAEVTKRQNGQLCGFVHAGVCGGDCGMYALCCGIAKPSDPYSIYFCQCQ